MMSDESDVSSPNMKFIGKRHRNQAFLANMYHTKNRNTWHKRWTLRPESVQLLGGVIPGNEDSASDMRFIGKRSDAQSIMNKRWNFRPKSLQILGNLSPNDSPGNPDMKFVGKRDSFAHTRKENQLRNDIILDMIRKIFSDPEN